MNGKILLVSVVLSALIVISVNTGILTGEVSISDMFEKAALDLGNIASFAFSNLVIFLILTGIIYLFVRGVVSSFGKPR